MSSLVLKVNPDVEFAYLDSGAPAGRSGYTTIFAVHGMIFTNAIFERMIATTSTKGIRLVAIQRRPFPGSTSFNAQDQDTIFTGGTEERRAAFSEARGHEIALFVDKFAADNDLPAISGSDGGSVLLGWSVGGIFPILAIAHSKTLPDDVKKRLGVHIRSVIIYESAPMCFGLPMPSQNYSPLVDEAVPQNKRLQLFGQWCTGYFDHGSFTLDTPHDPELLEWVLHTPSVVPTLYNIPSEKLNKLTTYGDDASTDLPFLFFFQDEHKKALVAALQDKEVAGIFPSLKRAYITGSKTSAFGIAGMWAIQDNKELSSAPIEYKIIPGGNHFAIWDEPDKLLNVVLALA